MSVGNECHRKYSEKKAAAAEAHRERVANAERQYAADVLKAKRERDAALDALPKKIAHTWNRDPFEVPGEDDGTIAKAYGKGMDTAEAARQRAIKKSEELHTSEVLKITAEWRKSPGYAGHG